MIISIFGANGFIGSHIIKNLDKTIKVKKINLRNMDLNVPEINIIKTFSRKLYMSDYVINCCASLKPINEMDLFINSEIPHLIQKSIYNLGKKTHLIHMSTLNIFLNQRTDDYTLSKKKAEKKLITKNTTILRLPFIIDENKDMGNLKILNKYLENKFIPIYPMISPGHIYSPIEINQFCLFINKFLKNKKKKLYYNLIGKDRLSLWEMFESIALKKNKKIIKIETSLLNRILNYNQKNRFIRNNDFLSQLFSIDHSKFSKITLTKL
jgi:dTDP-4-dehydrorhamnose reductase